MGDLFKDLVFDKLVSLALKKLFAKVAFLSWGPIGWFVTFIVNKFAKMLYEELEMHLAIQQIAFRNKSFEKEFNKESVKLKLISRDLGPESPEFLEAKNVAKKSLSNLVMFDTARAS